MKARRLRTTTALVLASTLLSVGPAGAAVFGSKPYYKVQKAARSALGSHSCSGLTHNKLAAAMMAVTYNESGGQTSSSPPSSATLGRYDGGYSRLYADRQSTSSSSGKHRLFWHPGVGLWQMDDSGLGSKLSAQKFFASGSASKIANLMAGRYCQYHSVSSMWGSTWYGCRNGACSTYFNRLYNSGSDKIQVRLEKMGDGAGNTVHTCQFGNSSTASRFACTYVKPARFQHCPNCTNFAGSDGFANPTPMAYPFYVFRGKVSGQKVEYRYWLTDDTGLSAPYFAYRYYGDNSRSTLNLHSASKTLCDLTDTRGVCPTTPACYPNRCN